MDRLLIEIKDHVAEVTLNRPDKFNAIDFAMWTELGEAGKRLAEDKSVRAVILKGAGENFCSGIDVSSLQQAGAAALEGDALDPLPGSPANLFQEAAYTWRKLPVPVIAVLHGYVFGAGLQLAAAADIRVATADAKLSIMEIKWGIIPDIAITATLRDIMSVDKIKELTYSGRILSGSESESMGLVTRICDDPLAAARQLASEIASKSPDAIRAAKTLLNEAWQQTEADGLRLEATLQKTLMGSANQMEAVMANIQKRKPDFSDPK